MGLTILGTAGTPKGLELAKREGAHQVFDHRKSGYLEEILKATGNRGVDIILEMLANVNLPSDTKLLARDGRVIVIGNRGEATINARELMARRASIRAFTLFDITPTEEAEIHAALTLTGRGGCKLLRQRTVRTGQFPSRSKNAAVEQKSTAIGFRWSVHEHDRAVIDTNQDQRLT